MNKKITTAFEAQRQACEMLGSPLTRDVVGFCADDFAANGVIAELVRGWQGDPLNDNVPLRLAGFAHYAALQGDGIGAFMRKLRGAICESDRPLMAHWLPFPPREKTAPVFAQRPANQ